MSDVRTKENVERLFDSSCLFLFVHSKLLIPTTRRITLELRVKTVANVEVGELDQIGVSQFPKFLLSHDECDREGFADGWVKMTQGTKTGR